MLSSAFRKNISPLIAKKGKTGRGAPKRVHICEAHEGVNQVLLDHDKTEDDKSWVMDRLDIILNILMLLGHVITRI